MRARTTAILLTAVLVVYFVLLTQRAVLLIGTGTAAGIGLGLGVLVLPLVGAWIAAANLWFGIRVERLARRLADEDQLPDVSALPRRPSGRRRAPSSSIRRTTRPAPSIHARRWRGSPKSAARMTSGSIPTRSTGRLPVARADIFRRARCPA